MSDRETGVEEARKVLGKLVDNAALDGMVTYLTRRGRRHAAIVPLDRVKETGVPHTEKVADQSGLDDFDAIAAVEEMEAIARKRDTTA